MVLQIVSARGVITRSSGQYTYNFLYIIKSSKWKKSHHSIFYRLIYTGMLYVNGTISLEAWYVKGRCFWNLGDSKDMIVSLLCNNDGYLTIPSYIACLLEIFEMSNLGLYNMD